MANELAPLSDVLRDLISVVKTSVYPNQSQRLNEEIKRAEIMLTAHEARDDETNDNIFLTPFEQEIFDALKTREGHLVQSSHILERLATLRELQGRDEAEYEHEVLWIMIRKLKRKLAGRYEIAAHHGIGYRLVMLAPPLLCREIAV